MCGFDVEQESISRCQSRFEGFEKVILSKSSFGTFDYPKASLVVADASLFFCPPAGFEQVWEMIHECLYSNGIFCGSFLGLENTMARPGNNQSALWSQVTAFEDSEVGELFTTFELLRFRVHKSKGQTPRHWSHSGTSIFLSPPSFFHLHLSFTGRACYGHRYQSCYKTSGGN